MAEIIVWESGDTALALQVSGPAAPDSLLGSHLATDRLVLRKAANAATLKFAAPIPVAERFLTADGANWRLKDLDQKLGELIDDAKNAADAVIREQKNRLVERFRELRNRLRETLLAAGIEVQAGGAGDFFGVRTFASAAVSATVMVDLAELLPEGAAPSTIVLHARATAQASVTAGAASKTFQWGIEITCSAQAEIKLAPIFELPDIPSLPPLNLILTAVDLPNLQIDGLTLGALKQLLRFDLPLPDTGVRIDWDGGNPPPVEASISGSDLVLKTKGSPATVYAGSIVGAVQLARLDSFSFVFANGALALTGTVTATAQSSQPARNFSFGGADIMPVTIDVQGAQSTLTPTGSVNLATGVSTFALETVLDIARIEIRAKRDPSLVLALAASYEATINNAGHSAGRVTRCEVIDPYPVKLVTTAAQVVADGLMRLIGLLEYPSPTRPDLPDIRPLLDRIGKLVAAALEYLADKAGAAARALVGVAEAAAKLLSQLLQLLKKAASAAVTHVAIEVRLDAKTLALRQIVISPAKAGAPGNALLDVEALGLVLSIPASYAPALVIDLRAKPLVALTIAPMGTAKASLATDLWLRRDGAGTEAIRDTDDNGARHAKRLINVDVGPKGGSNPVIALIVFEEGNFSFLRKLAAPAQDEAIVLASAGQVTVRAVAGDLALQDLTWSDVDVTVDVNKDEVSRLLPFFGTPKAADSGTSLTEKLSQYIKVTKAGQQVSVANRTVALALEVEIKLDSLAANTKLTIEFDVKDFSAKISGGDDLTIKGVEKSYDIFGLKAVVKSKAPLASPADEFPQFRLDFRGGDVRLALAPEATVDLTYRKIASSGRGLVFKVDEFAVARNVFDIEARVDPDEPVTMAGIDMPFRFAEGKLSVKRGEIQSFSIRGTGQLPPALVGEANATVRVAFSRGAKGQLEVQSAEAELDKSNDPLVCHGTRFVITITKLGFDYRDFGNDGGYHFFFTLTGSAEFTPRAGELSGGMLKYLPNLKIILDKAPLTSDARLLMRAIEFQVAVEPKKKINFFELFSFELRGIGFHPASPAFGGKPAVSISGQVNFVEAGDIVSPQFDFHKLWIAPPKEGQSLPQVRCDGLGVGLRLGGTATVEATAIAVDDKLPSIYAPDTLPADITARGFLASGRLSIKGWASMSAAMGFLELQRENDRPRHAFFLYGQANELSITIPTPIGNLYLREAGFGFGYRFTLAGLARADRVTNPNMLVEVLDDASRYQGDLDNVRAWQPEADGNRLTLALRAMFSIATASQDGGGLKEAEEKLSNPVLFDVMAALRSDLTFLMTVRAWIAVNYWTWAREKGRTEFADKPMLRGYLYISVPRQEFLARTVSDPKGHIGSTPELPAPLKAALQNTYWSSTLYIRPGLFHQEFGWPYELGFDFKQGDNIFIRCRGGMITRIEDFSLLYGIAFKADGYAQFGGQIGGRSFGASVTARADFSIEAKFIAYLSLKRFNDTLFYGSLAFSVTIAFGVRVWLEFSVGFTDIHLEVSFSARLTITVSLEFAATPGKLGGRGAATVSVSAFGRSLGIGVALSFNNDLLRDARARVERFLALGLEASVPDPAQGLAPPQPAQANTDANQSIENDAKKAEIGLDTGTATPSPPPDVKPDITGEPIGAAHFWAMLFEVAAVPGSYVMTFIPRDRTEVGIAALELADDEGTFFAPPRPSATLHDYEVTTTAGGLRRLFFGGDATPIEEAIPPGAMTPLSANHEQRLYGDGEHPLQFGHFIRECFVTQWQDGKQTGALLQPQAQAIKAERAPLPSDPAASARTLREAGLDQVNLSPSRHAWRDVEERRSAAISVVGDSAARIAASAMMKDGALVWPDRPTSGLDARDFGLTFYVKSDELRKLFPSAGPATPPVSTFTLKSRVKVDENPPPDDTKKYGVHLFNPREREFRSSNPRLAVPRAWLEGSAIKLDWDLEPGWEASRGLWHDPEFHLKHYRIQRTVVDDSGIITDANPEGATTFTSKAAAPLKSETDGTVLRWQAIRPAAQFVDDLTRLPQRFRDAILHTGDAPWQAWDKIQRNIKVIYTIVPVDISGTEGIPTPLIFQASRALEPPVPLVKAEFVVHYADTLPVLGKVTPVRLGLRVDDKLFRDETDKKQPQRRPRGKARYRLKIRPEHGYPSGLYGADALTQARQRPSPADFDRYDVGDVIFEFEVQEGGDALADDFPALSIEPSPAEPYCFKFAKNPTVFDGDVDKPGLVNAPKLSDLLAALGIDATNQLRPVRLALRRMKSEMEWDDLNDKDEKIKSIANTPSCVVDTILRVGSDRDAKNLRRPYPIDANVEVFEHPRDVAFEPLHFDDLDGEAGRLLVYCPSADADLSKLLPRLSGDNKVNAQGELQGIRRLRDPARRIGTRIRWNSRPGAQERKNDAAPLEPTQPAKDRDLIGGFNLFEIDMSTVASDGVSLVPFARPAARVQVLPKALANLDPAQIDDFGAVEAFYPSDTLRLSPQGSEPQDGNPRARRAAWFSPAESLPTFPRLVLRRSLAIDHEEAALTSLFARGLPHRIRLSLVKWPAIPAHTNGLPDIVRYAEGAPPETQPAHGFAPPAPATRWTPAELGRFLRSLAWDAVPALRDAIDELYRRQPQLFAQVRLQLSGEYLPPAAIAAVTIGEVELTPTLDTGLHPMLADVIDEMRWSDGAGSAYRRYSPVLDGAPQTKAESIAAFMDERPPERDPHGWAVLRTLGLATGLRLYDMERGDYLPPRGEGRGVLDLVNAAVRLIYPRYARLGIGAPFVEVIARSDGLMTMASFDEANPGLAQRDITDLIDNEALAMVQIALRPIPDGMSDGGSRAAQYFAVLRGAGKPADRMNFDPGKLTLTQDQHILIELVDITHGLAGGRVVPLAAPTDAIAVKLWNDSEAQTGIFSIDIASLPAGAPVALLRVTTATADGSSPSAADIRAKLKQLVTGDVVTDSELPQILYPAIWSDPAVPRSGLSEPFERFGAMPGKRVAALIFGVPKGSMTDAVDAVAAPHAFSADTYASFREHAKRRFAKDWPNEASPGECTAFVERLLPWLSRFLAHGAAFNPQQDRLPFALATLTRLDPWRVEPQLDGTMEILLLHKDRFARRRRYVVRPFGRYDSFVTAGKAADKPAMPGLAQPALDELPKDAMFDSHSVDITVPRTEPVTAPVIVSARRLDIGDDAIHSVDANGSVTPNKGPSRRVGRALEIVLSRHEEELLSEANRDVADGLQFEHVAVGFWREFAAHDWATAAWATIDAGTPTTLDLMPEIGDRRVNPPAPLSFPSSQSFGRDVEAVSINPAGGMQEIWRPGPLPERVIDGWRGITAIRTRNLPHFYRLHAVAYASSGVVVSSPSAAVVPEGYYENLLPWDDRLAGTHALRPEWAVERGADMLKIAFTIPLSRFIDGMAQDDRLLWIPPNGQFPDAFNLPDPAVSYLLALANVIGDEEIIGLSSEMELTALPPQKDEPKARYAVTSPGTRLKPFDLPDPSGGATPPLFAIPPRVTNAAQRTEWFLQLPTRIAAIAPEPPNIPLKLDAGWAKNLTQFEVPADVPAGGPSLWSQWRDVAPVGSATMTIIRPGGSTVAAWNAFMADIVQWRDAFAKYDPDAKVAFDILEPFSTGMDNAKWSALTGGNPPSIDKPITDAWRAGLPILPAWTVPAGGNGTRGQTVAIAVADWAVRDARMIGVAARDAVRAVLSSDQLRLTAGFQVFDIIARRYAQELRKRDGLTRTAADEELFKGVTPYAADIPIQLLNVANNLANAGIITPPIDLTCRVQIAVTGDDTTSPLWEDVRLKLELSGLFQALENYSVIVDGVDVKIGMAAAIVALGTLEETGGVEITLALPHHALRAGNDVALKLAAVEALGIPVTRNDADMLVLRRPPTAAELQVLSAADAGFAAFVMRAAQDQLFGPNRRPIVKILHGLTDPVVAFFRRAA